MTQAAAYETIAYDVDGPIATVLHDRPEVRNAENTKLLDELWSALKRAEADSDIRVIVIGGTGDHFSAGHDLKEAIGERMKYTPEQRWAYEERRYFGYAVDIWNCSKPTIARVQGACIAGGFMVANMCDLVVASDDAYFADPVAKSLAAAAVEVLVHPWVMGMRKAKEFLLTGTRIDAAEAYRIGMVNRLVPRDQLEAATIALAREIAAAPPFAAKLVKRSLNRTFDIQGFRASLEAHFDTHQLTHVTAEALDIRSRGSAAAIAAAKDRPPPAAT